MSVLPLGSVDVEPLAAWARAIDDAQWPQPRRPDERHRAAMVNSREWHGFGAVSDPVIAALLPRFPTGARELTRMLHLIRPGHYVPWHRDGHPEDWLARVHVPLTTNDDAVICFGDDRFHLEVGEAYRLDTRENHCVRNDGPTNRIHLLFDVGR